MNGQENEPRKFFPINNDTAFIDRSGQVVISAAQPELVSGVRRISATLGRFRERDAESDRITFGEFSEGLAAARWSLCPMCRNPFSVNGFIDETGRLVIPPKNSNTRFGSFHEGLAQYSERGWGFIDGTGRIVIPAKFYEVSDFSEGLAFVRLSEKPQFGYINQEGKLVIPVRFVLASDFHEGLAAVAFSKKRSAHSHLPPPGKRRYGFIDRTGKLVLHSKEWFEVNDFSEGLAAVRVEVTDNSVYRGYKDQRHGFIDRTGKFVIPPRFHRVQKFSEGRALFVKEGGYGFIDSKGVVVIKPEFVEAKPFAEGLAAVAINSALSTGSSNPRKLWGYINREGAWVINPQFQHVNSFNGGLAAVNCDEYGRNCEAYIDRMGEFRWQRP